MPAFRKCPFQMHRILNDIKVVVAFAGSNFSTGYMGEFFLGCFTHHLGLKSSFGSWDYRSYLRIGNNAI